MKVFYAGQNVHQQFSNEPNTTIIEKFTFFESNEIITHFFSSFSFNVIVTNKHFYIKGFLNGKLDEHKLNVENIENVTQICSNDHLVLLLTNTGSIFKINVENTPAVLQPIPNFINTDVDERNDPHCKDFITKIGCGKTITIALSKNGKVYNIPSLVNTEDIDVIDIACGREHAVLLTRNGSVYTWGTGSRGQLGHGDLEDETAPRLVETLCGININQISAGGWHTAAVSTDGDLYTWGWNVHCQLGFNNNNIEKSVFFKLKHDRTNKRKHDDIVPESISVMAIPKVVNINDNIDMIVKNIACGRFHTLILTDDNHFYGTGWNKYSQLGIEIQDAEHATKMTSIPMTIKNAEKIELQAGPLSSTIFVYE